MVRIVGRLGWASLFALAACSAQSAAAQGRPLRLVSDAWPPFTAAVGEPRIAIDLVTRALERSGIKTTVKIVAPGALTAALEEGPFDGTAALWRSPQREEYMLYSEPFLENRLILIGRKGTDVSATELSALKGKRVAIVRAYEYGESVERDDGPVFIRGASDQKNLTALLSGDIDYMLVDDVIAKHLTNDYPKESKRLLTIGRHPLVIRPLHFAVRRDHPRAEQIIARFNREISEMMVDGSFHEILEVGWIRTDMDGDGQPELILAGKKAGSEPPTESYDWLTVRRPEAKKKPKIMIEGVYYDNWDKVPAQYKVEPDPYDHLRREGGIRFRFDIGL